jgi:hypothetical protein
VIQTLHPRSACGDAPYADGWRDGSWAGIDGDFGDPAPWYFRTLEGWLGLLAECGFEQVQVREPLYPDTGRPASVLFIATTDASAG